MKKLQLNLSVFLTAVLLSFFTVSCNSDADAVEINVDDQLLEMFEDPMIEELKEIKIDLYKQLKAEGLNKEALVDESSLSSQALEHKLAFESTLEIMLTKYAELVLTSDKNLDLLMSKLVINNSTDGIENRCSWSFAICMNGCYDIVPGSGACYNYCHWWYCDSEYF